MSKRNTDSYTEEKICTNTDWSECNDSRPEEKDLRMLLDEKVETTQTHELAAQKANCILGWIKTVMAKRSRQVIFPLYSIFSETPLGVLDPALGPPRRAQTLLKDVQRRAM